MKKAVQWVVSVHFILLIILAGDHWIKRKKTFKKAISIHSIHLPASKPVAIHAPPKPAPSKKSSPALKSKKPVLDAKKKSPDLAISKEKQIEEKKPELTFPTLPQLELPLLKEEKPNPHLLVASFLQELLQLPEFGAVKVSLCISEKGIVESVEILESMSPKNEEFLKNRLAEISFPWLNEETKLTLVFRNDDS